MNDFLRNLRSSHKKETSYPRRNLDGHYYPKDDRRQISDRRADYTQKIDPLTAALQDSFQQIAENSNEISHGFQQWVHNNDLIAQAKLKQITSVTQFFDNLNTIFEKEFSPFIKKQADKDASCAADYIVGNSYTKSDILKIIKDMRREGSTFALIAKFLADKRVPTFSGKGQWHAQTIHRLCK